MAYGYDSRDEMTGEQSAQAGNGVGGASVYSDAFGYDLSYNPASFKGSTVTENIDNQFTLSGYAYDGNGNPNTYNGNTLTFDVENRLTTIASAGFSATYAPDDRRAGKTDNAGTIYYLYDEDGGSFPLLEEQISGGAAGVTIGYGMAADGLRSSYTRNVNLYFQKEYDPQGSVVQRQNGGTGVVGLPGANTGYYALDTAQYDGYGKELLDRYALTNGARFPNFSRWTASAEICYTRHICTGMMTPIQKASWKTPLQRCEKCQNEPRRGDAATIEKCKNELPGTEVR